MSEDPPRPAHACASTGPVAMGRRIQGRFPFRQFSSAAGRCRSSVVEHPLGKGEVVSSILTGSTDKSGTSQNRPRQIGAEQSRIWRAYSHQISTKCSGDVHYLQDQQHRCAASRLMIRQSPTKPSCQISQVSNVQTKAAITMSTAHSSSNGQRKTARSATALPAVLAHTPFQNRSQ